MLYIYYRKKWILLLTTASTIVGPVVSRQIEWYPSKSRNPSGLGLKINIRKFFLCTFNNTAASFNLYTMQSHCSYICIYVYSYKYWLKTKLFFRTFVSKDSALLVFIWKNCKQKKQTFYLI